MQNGNILQYGFCRIVTPLLYLKKMDKTPHVKTYYKLLIRGITCCIQLNFLIEKGFVSIWNNNMYNIYFKCAHIWIWYNQTLLLCECINIVVIAPIQLEIMAYKWLQSPFINERKQWRKQNGNRHKVFVFQVLNDTHDNYVLLVQYNYKRSLNV
jgi:hypothetical protein